MRIFSFLLACLMVVGIYFWLKPNKSEDNTEIAKTTETQPVKSEINQEAVTVSVMRSVPKTLRNNIILRGSTTANRRVDIKAQTYGLVSNAPLGKGDNVKKGDLRHDEAIIDERAASRLSQKGYTSEMAAKAALAQLAAADAAITRINIDIARTKITAPFDGILETNTSEVGSLLQNGSTCATIVDINPIKLVGFAQESTVEQISTGSDVRARLSTGQEISAKISFIARSGDAETRTFRIEATAENDDLEIRDGLTANIIIPLKEQRAHLLPQSALTLDDKGTLGVRIADGNRAKFTAIDMIKDDTDGIWVTGLTETADVIIIGQEYVRDGTLIVAKPIDPAALPESMNQ